MREKKNTQRGLLCICKIEYRTAGFTTPLKDAYFTMRRLTAGKAPDGNVSWIRFHCTFQTHDSSVSTLGPNYFATLVKMNDEEFFFCFFFNISGTK